MTTTAVAERPRAEFLAAPPRSLYLALFAVSGFAGLIYESIWTHYLKLFLGHAAYAQSLVLMIFMGGMALGAGLIGRRSAAIARPLAAYAAVEGAVGLLALAFHQEFAAVTSFLYDTALPAIGSPAAAQVLRWTVGALLILPASVLLGMTFPLMSAGLVRRHPGAPGESIALLYFTNSLGAAVGVLASGFWLIDRVGLPGTIRTAGLLNIGLAAAVWLLARTEAPAAGARAATVPAPALVADRARARFLLQAAFVTGASSFMYEVAWLRMLSLVLGATTHAFELMLSAFITGLAAGGLWIRRHVDASASPLRLAGAAQVLMGALAAATLPVYVRSFDWMAAILGAVSRTDGGYALFTVASHGIALAVMIPATFFAGMTLPLFTRALMGAAGGEGAIGGIYAANTLGGIAGVLFALNVGLPLLGLKDLVLVAAALDLALGLLLLARAPRRAWRDVGAAGVVALAAVALVVSTTLDPARLAAGVYRTRLAEFAPGSRVLSYRDGKTASVSLTAFPDGLVSLATNGKPDAALQLRPGAPPGVDEVTMVMAGAVPLAYRPGPARVANIGFGSGLTTHTLLASAAVQSVDTIEIEPEMVRTARGFGERVERAFADPRSHVYYDDAKSFLSTQRQPYDVIVAEPSNPWVSGVASLFSREFYARVARHLAPDGLFVQWLQLYEFDDRLVLSVLGALTHEFSDYAVYNTDDQDVLIVARRSGRLGAPDFQALYAGALGEDLVRVGLRSPADLAARQSADRRMVEALVARGRVPVNSDYFPYLDLNAGRARFLQESAGFAREWSVAPLPVLEVLTGDVLDPAVVTPTLASARLGQAAVALELYEQHVAGRPGPSGIPVPARLAAALDTLDLLAEACASADRPGLWRDPMHEVASQMLPFLDPARAEGLVRRAAPDRCVARLPAADAEAARLYLAVARRDAAGMATAGAALLDAGAPAGLPFRRYALAAAMLGELGRSDAAAAAALWQRYGPGILQAGPAPAHLELLAALATAPRAATGPAR